MAEAAGIFYAAETMVEGAVVAAKGIYDPTLPLKVTLNPIKDVPLPRYHHTVSLVKGRAYVFGGITTDDAGKETLADNDVHVIVLPVSGMETTDYKRIPTTSDSPPARFGHSAAVLDDQIYIFGGADKIDGTAATESSTVWVFDTSIEKWSKISPSTMSEAPPNRLLHAAVATEHPRQPKKRTDEGRMPQIDADPASEELLPEPEAASTYGTLIIHGGVTNAKTADALNDVWSFDIGSRTWVSLPNPTTPTRASPSPCLSLVGSRLYTYSAGQTQFMDLSTEMFNDKGGKGELGIAPISPWAPIERESTSIGPGERSGAGFEAVTTGQGRNYLLLIGGGDGHGKARGDVWTLQTKPEGMTAASFKDAARMAFKKGTGEREWAEVRYFDGEGIMVQEGQEGRGIGPRRGFASAKDWDEDGGSVFVHGGKVGGKVLDDGIVVTCDI